MFFLEYPRKWQPTPVFLSGESHRQRSLVGYSPWGPKESDMTEQLTHNHTHAAKGFRIVNKAQVDVFLEYPCFSYDPMDYGNLISGSSAFSKSTLYIWKFSLHVLLKPSLKNFEHYLASMWNECNCTVIWTFFGIDLLWDWNENWPFPVLWQLLSFLNLLA